MEGTLAAASKRSSLQWRYHCLNGLPNGLALKATMAQHTVRYACADSVLTGGRADLEAVGLTSGFAGLLAGRQERKDEGISSGAAAPTATTLTSAVGAELPAHSQASSNAAQQASCGPTASTASQRIMANKADHTEGQCSTKAQCAAADIVRGSLIGRGAVIATPFGERVMTYADWTASGRLLSIVEDFMQREVHPWYANVHTEVGACGVRMNQLYEDARATVAGAVNADTRDYAVLFCGAGMTAAIAKLAHLMGIHRRVTPRGGTSRWPFARGASKRPVVLVSGLEHHSNCVFWRELDCVLRVIPEDAAGVPDLGVLEHELRAHAAAPLVLGCFSAGSNVTGIRPDVPALTRLLRRHGALVAFDFAAAGSCSDVRAVFGPGEGEYLDAVMLSPHKYPGGPGSSGVLLVRRDAVRSSTPQVAGGGTVQYVTPNKHWFLEGIEAREEPGSPNPLAAIRAALAMGIQRAVGPQHVHAEGARHCGRVLPAWASCPAIHVLGSDRAAFWRADRLSIVSFNVIVRRPECGKRAAGLTGGGAEGADGTSNAYLHPQFVAALLNDVYGIQARAGCSCAAPYGAVLLAAPFASVCGFNAQHWAQLEKVVVAGNGWAKSGWVRVNFNYLMTSAEVDYIKSAVLQVAQHGWKLLPNYRLDPLTGIFRHTSAVSETASACITAGVDAALLGSSTQRTCSNSVDVPTLPESGPGRTNSHSSAAAHRQLWTQHGSERADDQSDLRSGAPLLVDRPLMSRSDGQSSLDDQIAEALCTQLRQAQALYAQAEVRVEQVKAVREDAPQHDADCPDIACHPLRWFLMPHEAAAALARGQRLAFLEVEADAQGHVMNRSDILRLPGHMQHYDEHKDGGHASLTVTTSSSPTSRAASVQCPSLHGAVSLTADPCDAAFGDGTAGDPRKSTMTRATGSREPAEGHRPTVPRCCLPNSWWRRKVMAPKEEQGQGPHAI